jgi:hypothetical protein
MPWKKWFRVCPVLIPFWRVLIPHTLSNSKAPMFVFTSVGVILRDAIGWCDRKLAAPMAGATPGMTCDEPRLMVRSRARPNSFPEGRILIWIKTTSLAMGFHLLIRVSGASIWRT